MTDLEARDHHPVKNDTSTSDICGIEAGREASASHRLRTHFRVSNLHIGLRPNYWGNWHGTPPSQWLGTGISQGAGVLLGTTVGKDSDFEQMVERPVLQEVTLGDRAGRGAEASGTPSGIGGPSGPLSGKRDEHLFCVTSETPVSSAHSPLVTPSHVVRPQPQGRLGNVGQHVAVWRIMSWPLVH